MVGVFFVWSGFWSFWLVEVLGWGKFRDDKAIQGYYFFPLYPFSSSPDPNPIKLNRPPSVGAEMGLYA